MLQKSLNKTPVPASYARVRARLRASREGDHVRARRIQVPRTRLHQFAVHREQGRYARGRFRLVAHRMAEGRSSQLRGGA